jgi:hypothetical protein
MPRIGAEGVIVSASSVVTSSPLQIAAQHVIQALTGIGGERAKVGFGTYTSVPERRGVGNRQCCWRGRADKWQGIRCVRRMLRADCQTGLRGKGPPLPAGSGTGSVQPQRQFRTRLPARQTKTILSAGHARRRRADREHLSGRHQHAPDAPCKRHAVGPGSIEPVKALPWIEQRIGLALAESQVAAVQLAPVSKVLVMTGGPGVGKTTIVNATLPYSPYQNAKQEAFWGPVLPAVLASCGCSHPPASTATSC